MATRNAAQNELANETFASVEKLIWHAVHAFHARHGDLYGTREELFAEGCTGFAIAYKKYDPSKGSFPTYVRTVVGHTLLENMRNETKRRVRYSTSSEIEVVDNRRPFSLAEFLDEVSEDARAIVQLVLETPGDLLKIVQQEKRDAKHTLRQYLDGLGWEDHRVSTAFAEISTALC